MSIKTQLDESGKRGFDFFTFLHTNGTYYDEEGYDINGFDKEGYNKEGINRGGYDRRGLFNGFNVQSRFHINGTYYDEEGYDIDGKNSKGYTKIQVEKIKKLYKNLLGNFRGIKTTRSPDDIRLTHCRKCKSDLSSEDDVICYRCKWLVCECGACGCDYWKNKGKFEKTIEEEDEEDEEIDMVTILDRYLDEKNKSSL